MKSIPCEENALLEMCSLLRSKCIFPAIIAAISLISFTNIVKTNLVKIMLFKAKISVILSPRGNVAS
jgi:hypothetical protein